MSYEECIRSTYLDLESWIIVVVGLVIALILRRFGRTYAAAAMTVVATLGGLFWAYGHYELNCVELNLG